MITVRLKSTGEFRELTRNEAFDLVDRGVAELVVKQSPKKESIGYLNRQIRPRYRK